MKEQYARDLTDDLLSMAQPNIAVELNNGQRLHVDNYYRGSDGKGNMIIILKVKNKN